MNMKNVLLLISATLLLASCATNQNPTLNTSESLDFTFNKEEAEKYWVSEKIISPKFPAQMARQGLAGCSRFKISITGMGKTEDIELIESYPSNAFVASSIDALKKWTWKPAVQNKNRREITRSVQLDFYIPKAKNYIQAKEHCFVGKRF
jgi:TonB family protein